jgi:hypothetical protein
MKALFLHKPKTAGTYLDIKFINNASPIHENNFLYFNPWQQSYRDWSCEECKEIANLKLNCNMITHIHSSSLGTEQFYEFKKNNWFSFIFIRDPLDIICSLYYFFKFNSEATLNDYTMKQVNFCRNNSLNDFCVKAIHDNDYRVFWVLPEYFKDIDFVGIPTKKCFEELFRVLSLVYKETEKANSSKNKGYKLYANSGAISKSNQLMLENDEEIKRQLKLVNELSSTFS